MLEYEGPVSCFSINSGNGEIILAWQTQQQSGYSIKNENPEGGKDGKDSRLGPGGDGLPECWTVTDGRNSSSKRELTFYIGLGSLGRDEEEGYSYTGQRIGNYYYQLLHGRCSFSSLYLSLYKTLLTPLTRLLYY